MSDPVLAFQSLLALYRRDDAIPSRRKNVPKRIIPSSYNPPPCETKAEGGGSVKRVSFCLWKSICVLDCNVFDFFGLVLHSVLCFCCHYQHIGQHCTAGGDEFVF